jgi:hypothetical protein
MQIENKGEKRKPHSRGGDEEQPRGKPFLAKKQFETVTPIQEWRENNAKT